MHVSLRKKLSMRSSLDLSTTWWRVAYPHLQRRSSDQLIVSNRCKFPLEVYTCMRIWIKCTFHTWLWHFSQGSEEYPFQHANRKDFWSPVGHEGKPWVKDNEPPPPPPLVLYFNRWVPGTGGRLTQPALVSGGRRAHQEPAAASCISLAKPRSASRWRSRRHAGKSHYLHHHSAPGTQSGSTKQQLDATKGILQHMFTQPVVCVI